LLQEYRRVCIPGGTIRVTEAHIFENNSPAASRLNQLMIQTWIQSGRAFPSDDMDTVSRHASLLAQQGVENVQTRACTLLYRSGTPEWHNYYEDIKRVYRTVLPFLRKWVRVPDDYDTIYQQALTEMQQPDFVATLGIFTVWGNTHAE
jgi:ubiquinone/menaquinone biosynthesis C-methylase UbiE